jgi:hypothetical protein
MLRLSELVVVDDDNSHEGAELQPRIQLIQALRKLSKMLDDLNMGGDHVNDASCAFLIQVEEHLQQLREVHLPEAASSNQDDSSSILLLKQELDAISSSSRSDTESSHWSWILLSYSLVATLLHQLGEEMSSILETERALDSIFVEDGLSTTQATSTLSAVISTLERGALMENPTYFDAVRRLEMEEQGIELPTYRYNQLSIATTRRRRRPNRRHCRLPTDSTVNGTIEQFLIAPPHELCPVSAILVVGDEGSGKSHVCEKAERLARNKCSGQSPLSGRWRFLTLSYVCVSRAQ